MMFERIKVDLPAEGESKLKERHSCRSGMTIGMMHNLHPTNSTVLASVNRLDLHRHKRFDR